MKRPTHSSDLINFSYYLINKLQSFFISPLFLYVCVCEFANFYLSRDENCDLRC